MREVELYTKEGEFVAVVEIGPFPDAGMPKVVMWGLRFFFHTGASGDRWTYSECFVATSFTKPPGKAKEEEPEPPPVDRTKREVLGKAAGPGQADTSDRGDGQQRGYVVLSEEERKKGFVRHVRRSYIHVGKRPKHPTRDLTPEEKERFKDDEDPFVTFEVYPEGSRGLGRYWTAKELNSGCGGKTTMGQPIAETYARDPKFYSGTFCVTCGAHFPVGEDGEFVWVDAPTERVGT